MEVVRKKMLIKYWNDMYSIGHMALFCISNSWFLILKIMNSRWMVNSARNDLTIYRAFIHLSVFVSDKILYR